MQIINQNRIKAHFDANHDHAMGLSLWFKVTSLSSWQDAEDLSQAFPNAERTGRWTTFKLCRGECLVQTLVDFQHQKVYVRKIYQRADYEASKQ